MSYNPDISAARREAKRHARETGSSYQAALEAVARRAGAASWSEFLIAPAPIPSSEGPVDVGTPAETDVVEAIPQRRPRRFGMKVRLACLLILATMGLAWMQASSIETRRAENAKLAWERTTAVSSRMRSRFPDNDRTMYVIARRLPMNRRDVRLVMLDNRPKENGLVTWVMLATGMIDQGTRTYDHYMGGDGVFPVFDRHPVARLHMQADCGKGTMRDHGTEIADDMTSPPVAVVQSTYRQVKKLGKDDLADICSTDTLDRSLRVERGG